MTSFVERIDTLPETVYHRFFKDNSRQTIARVFSFAMMGATVALVILFLRKTKLNRVLLTATGIIEKDAIVDEPVVQRNRNRAKYLMRESARLVASAIEKSGSNLLEAYENAAQAAVLARTAKEIDDDIGRLSEELGVDFHQYLSYTSTVVQGLRQKLRHG